MNDFTKEELEDLHYYTKRYHEFNEFFQPTEFLNKIQSMIDNYCEHEPKESSISYTNYFCIKCGKEIV